MTNRTPVSQPNSRNRINDWTIDHPFTDYWDVFVLKHQNPANIALHLIGILFFYGLIFCVWIFHNPWLLIGLPLTQTIGAIGHHFFEPSHIDRQDAIFSWRASYCLGKLLWRILLGKYGDDIQQRQLILQQYRSPNQIDC
jgi:hypothetical protein